MRPIAFFRILLICAAILLSPVVLGAEFALIHGQGDQADSVSIRGDINPGDYEKFQKFLIQPDNFWAFANRILLSSNGGSVVEALKFANLFEQSFAHVLVSDQCYSSCFIMYAGAVDRELVGMGALGVHRMSLRESETDINKVRNLISKEANSVNGYLAYLGIPSRIIDKMNETPASSLYKMDHWVLQEGNLNYVMQYQPIFLDVIEKKCGKNPDPYPGEFVRDKPRNRQILADIGKWVECENYLRLKNFNIFQSSEYKLLLKGQPSILFPSNSLTEVDRNVNGIK